jgi:hypothetical protein
MIYKTRKDLNSAEKIYWFLRYLVETDKGGFHKDRKSIIRLRDSLGASLSVSGEFSEDEQLSILSGILTSELDSSCKKDTKKHSQYMLLGSELIDLFTNITDLHAFVFCLDKLLLPSTNALDNVPSSEASEIAKTYAVEVLKNKGTQGLANILREWDSITLDICLNRERDIATGLFKEVRKELESNAEYEKFKLNSPSVEPSDIILSALIQEFERRLGQKRKQRSGQDLEDATSFIFEYYGIPCASGPQHFTAAIEVDNWTKDKKGWYIGFSLKRTLRERWKQTVVDKDTLTEFKIRNILHLICNDGDLTENKIADMGSKRHLFFVPDNSHVIKMVESDSVLKDYVKPMSSLITFLKQI